MVETRKAGISLFARATKLIEAAKAGGPITAMTAPPTITIKTSADTAIASGVDVWADRSAVFNFIAARPLPHNITGFNSFSNTGPFPFDMYYPGSVRRTGGAYRGNAGRVRFGSNGRYLDLLLFNSLGSTAVGSHYRIWVDGKPTALTPRSEASSWNRVQMDFAAAGTHVIEVEYDQYVEFAGATREKDYDIWFEPDPRPTIVFEGDSYIDGGSNSIPQMQNAAQETAALLGATAWNLGESGIGYAQNGNQSGVMPVAKLALDAFPAVMDWAVLMLAINDDDKLPADVQTNVAAVCTGLWAKDPQLPITVIGPWRAPSLNPPNNIFAAVKAGVEGLPQFATKQVYYADTLADNWQQNAGRVGATSGSGNSNVYIGADAVHPVLVGYQYLGARSASAILRHARAMLAA